MLSNADLMRVSDSLMDCYQLLCAPVDSGQETTVDLMLCIHALATQVANRAEQCMQNKQKCPGLYWRTFDGVQERLITINQTKKRRIDTTIQCKSDIPQFQKGSFGPDYPKGDSGSQLLCTACYQTFIRDKRAGIYK